MAKRILEIHARLSKLETICLIPTNLYGMYDNFSICDGHVIPALIHKCYISKKCGQQFLISGNGTAKRQFLYNGDMAKIIKWAIEKKNVENNHELFICAPDESEEIDINTIARLIAKSMNYENEFLSNKHSNYNIRKTSFVSTNSIQSQDGQIRKTASNKHLKEAFPELKFSNLEEKIQKTVDWFITYYDSDIVRK